MLSKPNQTNAFQQEHVKLLRTSFLRHTGQSLLPDSLSDVNAARELFRAPWAVVSHDTADDPLFTYGNQAALDLFEMSWEEFTSLPSRRSAEPVSRAERERLLEEVTVKGFIQDYTGIRISKRGTRFLIRSATVWNLVDEAGRYRGQAAVFRDWKSLP